MSTVTLPAPALQTPAGLDALQVNLQHDLHGRSCLYSWQCSHRTLTTLASITVTGQGN